MKWEDQTEEQHALAGMGQASAAASQAYIRKACAARGARS